MPPILSSILSLFPFPQDPCYAAARWEEPPSDDTAAYVQRWLAAELHWPSALRAAASRPRPPQPTVAALALNRRSELCNAYRAARRISWLGVRVDASGKAIAIGREPIEECRSLAEARMPAPHGEVGKGGMR